MENSQVSGSSGSVIFDGLGDDGEALRIGIYIIFLQAINEGAGVFENLKTVVVVARNYNCLIPSLYFKQGLGKEN